MEIDLPKRHLSVITTDSINYYRKESTNKLEKIWLKFSIQGMNWELTSKAFQQAE